MQRVEDGGVVISCDFCGTDWDEVLPMIEGHHGSVVCLECLKRALVEAAPGKAEADKFGCVMCLRDGLPVEMERWSNPERRANANPQGVICWDCVEQAARAFDKDPDVNWKWPREGRRRSAQT